jgi:hypothetical protein
MAEGQQKKTQTATENDKGTEGKGKGRQHGKFRRQGTEHKKKDPDAVPILKYGPGNNFMRFKEALLKKALEDYGTLGKVIKQGKIEPLKEPDKTGVDLADEFSRMEYVENMRTYRKLKTEQEQQKPKYLSDESLDAVQKVQNWEDIEKEVDPERLWQAIEEKHKVHSTSEVAAVIKLEARNQLQSLRQGGFESIISYKQRYNNALQAYHDQGNLKKDGIDQAMDFFHGLDNGRYADFKVQYLNGLQVKSIPAPTDLNTVFNLTNNWLKPKALAGGGYASTYATKVDHVEKKKKIVWATQGRHSGRRKKAAFQETRVLHLRR